MTPREELVQQIPYVNNLARRWQNSRVPAEDIAQAVFVKALASLERFEPGTNMKSWLTCITHTVAMDLTQAEQRTVARFDGHRPEAEALTVSAATRNAALEDQAAQNERSAWLRKAIAALPDHFRETLRLHIYEGLTCYEVAERLRVSVNTVLTRWRRARGHLTTYFKEAA